MSDDRPEPECKRGFLALLNSMKPVDETFPEIADPVPVLNGLQILRQRWDEGKASGRAGALDIERLIAEERAKRNDKSERG